MKILCDRQQLQEAFSIVSGIAPLKTPKPIIQNVLLRAENDSLSLFATDLEMSARVSMDSVKVKEPGSALLPARETNSLLRELSDPTLSIEVKEFRSTLQSGGGSFVLLGEDPEFFPRETEIKQGRELCISAGLFMDMVSKTIFATAREETRYAINGLLLESAEGCLRLVGTDGRRLALRYENLDGDIPEIRAIIPNRTFQALARIITEESDQILKIIASENQVAFTVGKRVLISQLLENRFPDYENVIPKAADTSIEINTAVLERNLRRVAVLSSGDGRTVRFNFTATGLELNAESSGVGRADLSMEVEIKGAGGAISFNPDYLLDALKVTELETLRIDMSDEATPAKFTLGESYTYILMPISGS